MAHPLSDPAADAGRSAPRVGPEPPEARFLGRVGYADGLRLQREAERRLAAGGPETILLLEHAPVITLGKNADRRHVVADPAWLSRAGIEVAETDRGGDVTYHGPGQLVGYPILDLARRDRDLGGFLWRLEESLIRTLASLGIESARREGLTGVWVGEEKVAAMGIHVRRWITTHGFALNVAPDLGHFDAIVPCGIRGAGVTSIERLLGAAPSLRSVAERFLQVFVEILNQPVPRFRRKV